jgi:hypothetical protein
MSSLQNVLVTLVTLIVTFSVTAVVWITLAAGLYQLVRDNVNRLYEAPRGQYKLAQSQKAG